MQEQFAQKMIEILNLFTETQSENMKTVADIIVDRIKEGGRFFVFGTGHSHMVGEEFYARAGGLACVQLIAPMAVSYTHLQELILTIVMFIRFHLFVQMIL